VAGRGGRGDRRRRGRARPPERAGSAACAVTSSRRAASCSRPRGDRRAVSAFKWTCSARPTRARSPRSRAPAQASVDVVFDHMGQSPRRAASRTPALRRCSTSAEGCFWAKLSAPYASPSSYRGPTSCRSRSAHRGGARRLVWAATGRTRRCRAHARQLRDANDGIARRARAVDRRSRAAEEDPAHNRAESTTRRRHLRREDRDALARIAVCCLRAAAPWPPPGLSEQDHPPRRALAPRLGRCLARFIARPHREPRPDVVVDNRSGGGGQSARRSWRSRRPTATRCSSPGRRRRSA